MSKKCCPVQPPKMWNMKSKSEEEILRDLNDSVSSDVILQCDCECTQCKAVYKSYLEEKGLRKILEISLETEKNEMDTTINEIMEQEKDYNDRINALIAQLATSEKLVSELQKLLQSERNLRMEEIYRSDYKIKESEAVFEELNTLKTSSAQQIHEIETLKMSNARLESQLNLVQNTNASAVAQLQKYEQTIFDLERKNDHIRIRLNDSDTAISTLHKKNDNLLAKLEPKHKPALGKIPNISTHTTNINLLNTNVTNFISQTNLTTHKEENAQLLQQATNKYENIISSAHSQLLNRNGTTESMAHTNNNNNILNNNNKSNHRLLNGTANGGISLLSSQSQSLPPLSAAQTAVQTPDFYSQHNSKTLLSSSGSHSTLHNAQQLTPITTQSKLMQIQQQSLSSPASSSSFLGGNFSEFSSVTFSEQTPLVGSVRSSGGGGGNKGQKGKVKNMKLNPL